MKLTCSEAIALLASVGMPLLLPAYGYVELPDVRRLYGFRHSPACWTFEVR